MGAPGLHGARLPWQLFPAGGRSPRLLVFPKDPNNRLIARLQPITANRGHLRFMHPHLGTKASCGLMRQLHFPSWIKQARLMRAVEIGGESWSGTVADPQLEPARAQIRPHRAIPRHTGTRLARLSALMLFTSKMGRHVFGGVQQIPMSRSRSCLTLKTGPHLATFTGAARH